LFNVAGLFCVVDFDEGPQIIPSNWLSSDKKTALWPEWANVIDQVRFDRNVKRRPDPEEEWSRERVLRVRFHGGKEEPIWFYVICRKYYLHLSSVVI